MTECRTLQKGKGPAASAAIEQDSPETSLAATSSTGTIFPTGIKQFYSPANPADAVVEY